MIRSRLGNCSLHNTVVEPRRGLQISDIPFPLARQVGKLNLILSRFL